MNIIVTLCLSISILTVAIVQYKITKSNRERFGKINEEIKENKDSLELVKNQVEHYHGYDKYGHLDVYSLTVKGTAERALELSKYTDKKIERLEDYLGIKYVEIPERPATKKYKLIKKKATKKKSMEGEE